MLGSQRTPLARARSTGPTRRTPQPDPPTSRHGLFRRAGSGAAAAKLERLGRKGRERPVGGDVMGARDVDGVISFVHPGRLDEVRGVAKGGVADQVAETASADPPRTKMFVPVGARPELGSRIVEVD